MRFRREAGQSSLQRVRIVRLTLCGSRGQSIFPTVRVMPKTQSLASRGLGTRLRQLGAFVAIVWAVAGSFIAFELVSLRGMDLALAHPAMFRNLLLSRATQASKACEV